MLPLYPHERRKLVIEPEPYVEPPPKQCDVCGTWRPYWEFSFQATHGALICVACVIRTHHRLHFYEGIPFDDNAFLQNANVMLKILRQEIGDARRSAPVAR